MKKSFFLPLFGAILISISFGGLFYFLQSQEEPPFLLSSQTLSGAYNTSYHHYELENLGLERAPDLCLSISDLKQREEIWSISLARNSLQDFSVDYSCFPNLQELNLSYNKLIDVNKLEKLSFLKILDLTKNQLQSLPVLPPSLQELRLGYNQISNTSGIERLNELQVLELQHNKIVDLRHIEKLTLLKKIHLEYNQLQAAQISYLEKLKNLQYASLGENPLPKEILEKWNTFSLQQRLPSK